MRLLRHPMVRLFVAVTAAVALQGCYVTHDYHGLEEAPEIGDTSALSVDIGAVAGDIVINAAKGDRLYELAIRYCRSHFAPRISRTSLDSVASLSIGMKRRWEPGRRPTPGDERNLLELALTPGKPIDLRLDVGAGRHNAELGGLRLRSLDVASGSGRTTIGFNRPTAGELEHFRVSGGSGGVRLKGLGHASPSTLTLEAGGGEFEIDLSGSWDKDSTIHLNVRLGDIILLVPGDLGVTISATDRDVADMLLPDFTRAGEAEYRSPGFEKSKRRITIAIGPGLGIVEARLIP